MKNYLILALLAAASCSPCRHLATSSRDSLRVEIRTRTEYVLDTLYREIPAQSERVTVRDTSSHLENDYAFTDARINSDGSLFHALATKPRREPIPYERPVERRDSIVYRDSETQRVVQVPRELTWWQKFRMNGFWVLAAVLVFVLRKQIAQLMRRLL